MSALIHLATAATGCDWSGPVGIAQCAAQGGADLLGNLGNLAKDAVNGIGQTAHDVVGTVQNTIANSVVAPISDVFLNAWAQTEMFFLASWVAIPLLVDVTDPSGTVAWLQGILGGLTFLFAVLGTLVAAGWTFLQLGTEKIRNLGGRYLVLLLVSVSGSLIIATADAGVRAASVWLLTQVGVGTGTGNLISMGATAAAKDLNPGITLIIGIVATVSVIIQWGIMIARGPIVVLLLGVWPMVAAAATIGGKKAEASFERVTAWLFAFVIYPFPAAIVYAAALRLRQGADGLGGIMYSFVLELLAIFLLPALLRIIAPATRVLGEKYGGKIAAKAAITAAETGVAVGAAVVTAGAASGMIAGKLGAAQGAKGVSAKAGTGAGNTTGGGGKTAASSGGSSTGAAGGGADTTGTGASGADTVGADHATPTTTGATGSAPTGAGTGETRAPASRPAPAPGTRRAARPPAPRTPATGAGAAPAAGLQAGGQAAQIAASAAGRSAREALDEMDEFVGGHHD